MKKGFSLKLLSILLLFTGGSSLTYAQILVKEIPLNKQVESSSLVIEGKVIGKESFWNHDYGLIYTTNTIEVYKVFKGKASRTVEVITLGGVVGLKALIVSPSLKLSKGDVGVFMLQNNEVLLNTSKSKSNNKAYTSSKGFYRYNLYNDLVVNAITSDKIKGIKSSFYNEITDLTNEDFVEVSAFNIDDRLRKKSTTKGRLAPSDLTLDKLIVSAGTKEELTITGSDFGEEKGKVWFSHSNDGGASFISALDSQVISWEDTEIIVEVPSSAGTGSVFVEHDDTSKSPLSSSLTISYAEINVIGDFGQGELAYPVQHVATNGNGGYTLEMFTDFFNDIEYPGAKASFERAFNNWVCETGINWTISDSASDVDAAGVDTMGDGNMDGLPDVGDGTNIIRFDNEDELETITMNEDILGTCFSWYVGCGQSPVKWYVGELDLVFDDDTVWNFGPEPTNLVTQKVDFESVVLHELGHGHQLGHVNDEDNSMNFNITSNQDFRVIEPSNITGANNVMERSTGSSICGGVSSMTDALCPLSIVNQEFENLISIYPNPTNGVFYIKNRSSINLEKAIIYDVSGRLILEHIISIDSSLETINLSGIANGVYFINLLSDRGVISSKLLVD